LNLFEGLHWKKTFHEISDATDFIYMTNIF